MPRYTARTARKAYWDDWEWHATEPRQPILQVEDSHAWYIGVLDAHGRELVRWPEPIGFMNHRTGQSGETEF